MLVGNRFSHYFAITVTGVLLITLALVWVVLSIGQGKVRGAAGFQPRKVILEDYDLFDLGVTDVNGDNWLDIYTTNHSAQQSFLQNRNGEWGAMSNANGLSQDYSFPNLEGSESIPEMSRPGFYIYRYGKKLILQATDNTPAESLVGSIEVDWPVSVMDNRGATVLLTDRDIDGSSVKSSRMEFSLKAGQSVTLVSHDNVIEIPHQVELAVDTDLNHVFVGRSNINPTSHTISLHWRDRHSMAWADFDKNGLLDVFISRGGMKGMADQIRSRVEDELLYQFESGFMPADLASMGFVKRSCPARQVGLVDIEGDLDLDLYMVCGRRSFGSIFPNQLYRQYSRLEFTEQASSLDLDYGNISQFLWLDVDQDGRQDLLSVESDKLVLRRALNDAFETSIVVSSLNSIFRKIAAADFDQDGDFDVIAVSPQQTLVLRNDNGQFVEVAPEDLGLPNGAVTVNWVDADNDGLLDIHLLPSGLYRQNHYGQFELADGIGYGFFDRSSIFDGVCAWFDQDGDGDRDVLCSVERHPPFLQRLFVKLGVQKSARRYRESWYFENAEYGKGLANHWIQLELKLSDNGYPAMGAQVTIDAGGVKHVRTVGDSEGAHYSQGHYRIYVGLGDTRSVDQIEVQWPDNTSDIVIQPSIDKLHWLVQS